MKKRVLIEGILICFMGVSSIVEGIRLIRMKRIQLYDILGPGNYTLGVGVVLTILGLIYVISHYRKSLEIEKVVEKEFRIKMISMVVVLVIYGVLIYIIGYILASIVFFILMFRIVGFRSWLFIGGLSIGVSIFYYLIFIYWLSMVFPRGIIFP